MANVNVKGDAKFDPIEGILAVLDDGAATSTNKFGLLLALIDLAPTVDDSGVLTLTSIAEKLIELHWDHCRPFHSKALRQLTSGNRENTTVVLAVGQLHEGLPDSSQYEQAWQHIPNSDWARAVKRVERDTLRNPLQFLQNLPGSPPPFLYEIEKGPPARIRFIEGTVPALIRFGPVLRDLVEFRFVRFVATSNEATTGHSVEGDLAEHLFGAARHMPPPEMRHQLWQLQGQVCPYTGTAVDDPALVNNKASLDHVLPWSRVRVSAVENLLFTTVSVNSQKRNILLAPTMLSAWCHHHAKVDSSARQIASHFGWPSDPHRVAEVAQAMYRNAALSSPLWAGPGDISPMDEKSRESSLAILQGFISA